MFRHTFPKSERLRSKRSIDALFAQGKGGMVFPVRYIVLERGNGEVPAETGASVRGGTAEDKTDAATGIYEAAKDKGMTAGNGVTMESLAAKEESTGAKGGQVEVLVSVSKKYHKKAVARNLLKRRMREAYRLHKQPLAGNGKNLSLALLYVSNDILEYKAIEDAVTKIISKICSMD